MEINDESKDYPLIFSKQAKFLPSKMRFLSAGVFYFFAIIPSIGLLSNMKNGSIKKDALIPAFVGLLFCVFLAIVGTVYIASYFTVKKKMKAVLEKYGEETLRISIGRELLWYYQYQVGNSRVYLTERFVIAPSVAVFRYEDIRLITKHVTRTSKSNVLNQVAFYMKDETSISLCNGIKDEDIHRVFDICKQRNSDLLLGFSKENQIQLAESVEEFDKTFTESSVSFFEQNSRTRMKNRKAAFLLLGVSLILSSFLAGIGLYFSYVDDFKEEIKAITKEQREALLKEGYTEFCTSGTSLERVPGSKVLNKGEVWKVNKPVFIFQLENEDFFYLGISSDAQKFTALNKYCSGFDVFCKESGEFQELEGKTEIYTAKIVPGNNCKIYGIARDDAKEIFFDQIRPRITSFYIVGGFFLLVGVVIICVTLNIKGQKKTNNQI